MKRLSTVFFLLCAVTAFSEQRTFFYKYDLNVPTEAADDNQILAVVNLTNISFALTAQPDVPRNITIAITDTGASIAAGTITVTGLDVNGAVITEVLDVTGPVLTFTGTKVFETVSSVVADSVVVLDGGGDETIIVGTGSIVAPRYCRYSTWLANDALRARNAASSTTVLSTTLSPTSFARLEVGDLIEFRAAGETYLRVVTVKTSSASITVDTAVDLSGAGTVGYPFSISERSCDYDDNAGWVSTAAMVDKDVNVHNVVMTATAGLDYSIECRKPGTTAPTQLANGTLTTAILPGVPTPTSADLISIVEQCSEVRVGLKYHTTDTTGTDQVSAWLSGYGK